MESKLKNLYTISKTAAVEKLNTGGNVQNFCNNRYYYNNPPHIAKDKKKKEENTRSHIRCNASELV